MFREHASRNVLPLSQEYCYNIHVFNFAVVCGIALGSKRKGLIHLFFLCLPKSIDITLWAVVDMKNSANIVEIYVKYIKEK